MRVVIVGNGVAGIEAALAVRAADASASISVVSEESEHFFSRTALMYVLSGQMRQREIEPYPRDLYAKHHLERVRARATGVDPDGHRLLLAGALPALDYDRLLIACGSRPRPPPWTGSDLRGVGTFVTLQDLAWLEQEVHGKVTVDAPNGAGAYARRPAARDSRGRAPRSSVVIGGGLIGAEVVETLVAAGHSPTFLVREDWFWPVAIDARESAWVVEAFGCHGAKVALVEEVRALEGDASGNVARVVSNKGTHDAELVVVAIGVVPNTDWLAGSPIERDKAGGILVDGALATSARDVYAAGDCASVRWYDGAKRPEQLWYTARAQGRVAARGLLGKPGTYERGVWFNSAKLMDIEYTTVGLLNAGDSEWFFEEKGKVRSTSRIVSKGGKVVGMNFLGRRWDHAPLCRWIAEGRDLAFVLAHLEEARFDTELVPPLVLPR